MGTAAAERRAASAPPARRRRRHTATARRGVASGVVWIVVVALLLAGVVAVNVAVLRLNLRMDEANRQRADLRSDVEALSSELARASSSGRTEALARAKGLVPADPETTLYLDLAR